MLSSTHCGGDATKRPRVDFDLGYPTDEFFSISSDAEPIRMKLLIHVLVSTLLLITPSSKDFLGRSSAKYLDREPLSGLYIPIFGHILVPKLAK